MAPRKRHKHSAGQASAFDGAGSASGNLGLKPAPYGPQLGAIPMAPYAHTNACLPQSTGWDAHRRHLQLGSGLIRSNSAVAVIDPSRMQDPPQEENPTSPPGIMPGPGMDPEASGEGLQLLDSSVGFGAMLVSTHPDAAARWRALQGPQHDPRTAAWLSGLQQLRPQQLPGRLPQLSSLNLAMWASQGASTYMTPPPTHAGTHPQQQLGPPVGANAGVGALQQPHPLSPSLRSPPAAAPPQQHSQRSSKH